MSRNVNDLHPKVRAMALELIEACKVAGIKIILTHTLRTIQEQNELYAQGRTKPGKIVTNAMGGYSYHNYGLAFDVVPVVGKLAVWDDNDLWNTIGRAGQDIGLEWGGSWEKFKDKPHFQLTFDLTLAELRAGKKIPE